jgi:hypothetical protein
MVLQYKTAENITVRVLELKSVPITAPSQTTSSKTTGKEYTAFFLVIIAFLVTPLLTTAGMAYTSFLIATTISFLITSSSTTVIALNSIILAAILSQVTPLTTIATMAYHSIILVTIPFLVILSPTVVLVYT